MSAQTCDPKATQMDFVRNPQSAPSTLTDCENDELAYDSGSPSPPPRRGDRRILTRENRALCRVAVQSYSIPQIILRAHFNCSGPTIDKAIANSYAEKDVVAKDKEILKADPGYNAALKEVRK
ncbi:hypothetical protein DFH06DRAFT_1340182 [Mycena polygramma]|nr:hypothetical protein DFH06DRAFT_1340182 [Mycena polygramma]